MAAKGYVPLGNNATVDALPPEYEKYKEAPKTATSDPVAIPFSSPAVIPLLEGTAAAKKKKKEREPAVTPAYKATTAPDRMSRADPVKALFDQVDAAAALADPKESNSEKVAKAKRIAKSTAALYERFRDNAVFTDKLGKSHYPLALYKDAQKDTEENIEQYAKDITGDIYMPSTRKAFYPFINENFAAAFTLDRERKDPDPKACEALMAGGLTKVEPFRYQRFIKEYVRQSSPYRGLLVYHGLGSGKTCSAIAAAEALYGIANKRVIVMTPQSLRDNFIKEISFCGFRHFSLQNHWVKVPLLKRTYDEEKHHISNELRVLHEVYGRSVLSLSERYITRIKQTAIDQREPDERGKYTNAYLWIPDFNDDKSPNFDELTGVEKDLIKAQLNETINNRFKFINYNGITNADLMALCCQEGSMDNSVIVIDEIHNLTRLMRGKIEPFLFARSQRARTIKVEPVTPDRWVPLLCKPGSKRRYTRGYMFYRLLIGARNSKIIGLSGTPIINFPEELGVLTNVLAGYIDCAELLIDTLEPTKIAEFQKIAETDPRIDFIRLDSVGGGNQVLLSVFQEGYEKVLDPANKNKFLGVKRTGSKASQLGVKEVTMRIVKACGTKGIPINEDSIRFISHPRLPPDQDTFRDQFVYGETLRPDNKLVLQKRLTGLISYYKGAKIDFLPQVTSDVIVMCDFSPFAQKKYIDQRLAEIAIDSKKKDVDKAEGLFAVVEAFSKSPSPSSYRFRSRTCCIFAFPFDRPYPDTAGEFDKEMEEPADDLEGDTIEKTEDTPEEQEKKDIEVEKERAAVKGAAKEEDKDEKAAKTDAVEAEEGAPEEAGEGVEAEAAEAEAAVVAVEDPEAIMASAASRSYDYQKALAMRVLNRFRDRYLKKEDPEQLQKYSRKLYEILTRMERSEGPSLIYSTFEALEGLGVLSATLQANGYEEIKFTGKWYGAIELTEESKASLRKGPSAGIKRFIGFTGKVDRRQRRAVLAMFNNQWRDVPRELLAFLRDECGFNTDPKSNEEKYLHGEVIMAIGITGAGAEGISLRNVRQVHIMEPFWNLVRLEQVKGRAIRICSHMDLPMAERKVDIFTYISRFSADAIKNRDQPGGIPQAIQNKDGGINDKKEQTIVTSDENIHNIAVRKDMLSQEILKLMKEVAIDCKFNVADNEPLSCLVVKEGANPYMFDPELARDAITTGSEGVKEDKKEAPVEVVLAQRLNVILNGEKVLVLIGEPNAEGIAPLYAAEDLSRETQIGTIRKNPLKKIGWSNPRSI
jgi:hypothetical protein